MDLKSYLKKYNIEAKSFAKSIGVSQTSIQNYMAGRRKPTIDIASKIESATNRNVTYDDLLSWWKIKNGK